MAPISTSWMAWTGFDTVARTALAGNGPGCLRPAHQGSSSRQSLKGAIVSATPILGQLEPVDVREIWPDEARDFTPWLLDNAQVLGEALGIEVELDQAERSIGSFSLDLLGRDVTNDAVLIVENQLGQSDHIHLGQVLTYAGGTDASTIVWVATEFRQEHSQAIDCSMNEPTSRPAYSLSSWGHVELVTRSQHRFWRLSPNQTTGRNKYVPPLGPRKSQAGALCISSSGPAMSRSRRRNTQRGSPGSQGRTAITRRPLRSRAAMSFTSSPLGADWHSSYGSSQATEFGIGRSSVSWKPRGSRSRRHTVARSSGTPVTTAEVAILRSIGPVPSRTPMNWTTTSAGLLNLLSE